MLVYLKEATAILAIEPGDPRPIANVGNDAITYERDAVLVYTGTFKTMTGEVVVVTDDDIDRLSGDRGDVYTKLLSGGDVTYDQLAPIQTDHSRSSWDTVGRVMRTFKGAYLGRKALFGRLRFLGQDAVDRARDGRWTHLSVAANFVTGFLKELTVTPFPAAGGAKLLSEGEPMHEKLIKHLMETQNLSEADAKAKVDAMSETDRDVLVKQLAAPPGDGPKPLDAAKEAADKAAKEASDKAAADAEAERVKALAGAEDPAVKRFSEAKGKIVELARSIRRGSKDFGRDVRVAQLSEQINGLRASGRITPAEIKKIDIVKLAEASQDAQEMVLKSYMDRQPVILMGAYGSTGAPNVTDALKIGKEKDLLKEFASDAQFSKGVVKQLCGDPAGAAGANGSQNLTDSGMPAQSMMGHFQHLSRLMGEGKHDECKSYLSKMLSEGEGAIAPSVDPETEKRMSGVAENFKKLQNQVDELVKLFADAAGVDVAELA